MRVLLTGASGGIGRRLRVLLKPHVGELVLNDLAPPDDLRPGERFIRADLAKLDEVAAAVQGIDAIVHLGGHSVEGPWETILQANIVGTYNLFEAARRASVRRVVFASSNHVMGFYTRTQTIGTNALPLPDSRYGVSKAFGEALGAMYAHKHGIGVLCIRIGNVEDRPVDARRLAIWLDPNDLVSLIRIGLERDGLIYEVVYGMSDNARAWWENARATALNYAPSARSEDHAAAAIAATAGAPPDAIGDLFQGGGFCSAEYSTDRR